MVELNAEFRTVAVQAFGKFMHRFNLIVVAHSELCKGGRAAHVIDAADAGNNHSDSTLRTLFIIIHEALGRLPVGLPEAEFRSSHNRTVLYSHASNLHWGEQQIIHERNPPSFLYNITIILLLWKVKYFSITQKN